MSTFYANKSRFYILSTNSNVTHAVPAITEITIQYLQNCWEWF